MKKHQATGLGRQSTLPELFLWPWGSGQPGPAGVNPKPGSGGREGSALRPGGIRIPCSWDWVSTDHARRWVSRVELCPHIKGILES